VEFSLGEKVKIIYLNKIGRVVDINDNIYDIDIGEETEEILSIAGYCLDKIDNNIGEFYVK